MEAPISWTMAGTNEIIKENKGRTADRGVLLNWFGALSCVMGGVSQGIGTQFVRAVFHHGQIENRSFPNLFF